MSAGEKNDGLEQIDIHHSGYYMIQKGYEGINVEFEEFQPLDLGYDFYAPQTFEDENGRRILLGWMGRTDKEYGYPTESKGWMHALTIPRILNVKNGKLIQTPIDELKQLRKNVAIFSEKEFNEAKLNTPTYEIEFVVNSNFKLYFSEESYIEWNQKTFTIHLGEAGKGREEKQIILSEFNKLRLFADTSSIELFINDGEKVITSRYFEKIENRLLKFEGLIEKIYYYELEGMKIDYNIATFEGNENEKNNNK